MNIFTGGKLGSIDIIKIWFRICIKQKVKKPWYTIKFSKEI